MALVQAGNERDTRTAIFFGVVLCVLLAFFAVERRVAAYPAHNTAAATIAATGLEKPQQIAFTGTQPMSAPVLFLCILVLFTAACSQFVAHPLETQDRLALSSWAPIHTAVRPPPAL